MASNVFIKAVFQGADAERGMQSFSASAAQRFASVAAAAIGAAISVRALGNAIRGGIAVLDAEEQFSALARILGATEAQLAKTTRAFLGPGATSMEVMETAVRTYALTLRDGETSMGEFEAALARVVARSRQLVTMDTAGPLELWSARLAQAKIDASKVAAELADKLIPRMMLLGEIAKNLRAGLGIGDALEAARAQIDAFLASGTATEAIYPSPFPDPEYVAEQQRAMERAAEAQNKIIEGQQKFRDSLVAVGGDITFGWAGNLQRDLEDVREGFQLTFDLMEDNYDTTVKWTAAETALFDTMSGLAGMMSGRLAATLRTFKFTALDVIKSIGAAILDMIAQIAARLAASAIVAGLFSMFGMPFGASFPMLSGGLDKLFSSGGGKTAPGGGGRPAGASVMQVGEIRVSNTGWQDSWYESLAPRNARLEARGY